MLQPSNVQRSIPRFDCLLQSFVRSVYSKISWRLLSLGALNLFFSGNHQESVCVCGIDGSSPTEIFLSVLNLLAIWKDRNHKLDTHLLLGFHVPPQAIASSWAHIHFIVLLKACQADPLSKGAYQAKQRSMFIAPKTKKGACQDVAVSWTSSTVLAEKVNL